MSWKWISSSHPISDIRDWNNAQRLEIRPDFQRKEVWSPAARILLMDTILRNIPMPKVFLQAIIRNNDTYRVIIDGQQRIKAILSFLNGSFRLTKPYSGEYENRSFLELPSAVKEEFLSYKIDVNEIRNAPDDVVRDIYLRVNKYTVALNKQELRRADFPGDFLNLAEELAKEEFFEDSRVFTIANSKRMGDVEFVSELLALLLKGPQEKKETLDDFYLQHMEWDTNEKKQISDRFKAVLDDLLRLFDSPQAFSRTRFRQKADFYSLFAAIDDCRTSGGILKDKPIDLLREDLHVIDFNTSPESNINVLSRYAVQCVSQGNTLNSRRWRRDFLKIFLEGTFLKRRPSGDQLELLAELLADLYTPGICPTYEQPCPVCQQDIKGYAKEETFLTWPRSAIVFQLSNAVFIHTACAEQAKEQFFHAPERETSPEE